MDTTSSISVASLTELMSALSGGGSSNIELTASVACPHSITLPPGVSLTGTDKGRSVLSFVNGDGIGIQISKPVGTITVDEGVTTHGSIGNTLVKGVNMLLPAEAFSVKPGGVVEKFIVGGNLVTRGAKVTTYAIEGGKVLAIDIKGEVLAEGQSSDAVLVADKGSTPLTGVRAHAKAGKALVEAGGEITDRTGFSTH